MWNDFNIVTSCLLEIGPRDLAAKQVKMVRRDTGKFIHPFIHSFLHAYSGIECPLRSVPRTSIISTEI